MSFEQVKLSNVISLNSDFVDELEDRSYKRLSVRLYGNGIEVGEIVHSNSIVMKKHQIVKTGQIVLSMMWGKKGAIGIVPKSCAGGIITTNFYLFDINTSKIETAFFDWIFRANYLGEQLMAVARGTASNATTRPKQLLDCSIPLPPLTEQRRIVERIESLARRVNEAQRLRAEAEKETEAIIASARYKACIGEFTTEWRQKNQDILPVSKLLEFIASRQWDNHAPSRKRSPMNLPEPPQIPDTWKTITFGELQEIGAILEIQDGNHGGDYPRQSEFSDDGIPFVTAKQMFDDWVDIRGAPRLPKERAAKLRIGFAKGGDVLISHNASVGKVVRAPVDAGDFLIGTSATYYRCNSQAVEPKFLVHFMKSDLFQSQLHWIMKQTTRNQVSVMKQVNLWICLPPLDEQRRIVAYLDGLQAKVSSLRKLQSKSGEELSTLMPSILDKAFKGEL